MKTQGPYLQHSVSYQAQHFCSSSASSRTLLTTVSLIFLFFKMVPKRTIKIKPFILLSNESDNLKLKEKTAL